MTSKEKTQPRHCLYCEKQIEAYARPEKVYCNVDCKNNYNSRKKAELQARGASNQGEILKIIKNNYQLLLQYKADQNQLKTDQVSTKELEDKGFVPSFFTSICESPDGTLWKCCFDIAYHQQNEEQLKLRYLPVAWYINEDQPEQPILVQCNFHQR